jgi:hypothetical protein
MITIQLQKIDKYIEHSGFPDISSFFRYYSARPLNPPQGDFYGIDPSLGEPAERCVVIIFFKKNRVGGESIYTAIRYMRGEIRRDDRL